MPANDWIAPENFKIPDFIICGAMKAGTTTLHHILNEHPHIHIPNNELHFFDIDNVFQHPDFNYFDGRDWIIQQLTNDPMLFWRWYSSHFDGAANNQIIGEDSTTYLASEAAAKRIQLQKKKIKLIIMLRHPTGRAYSQYLHMIRTGRAMYSFEDTIRFNPYSILHRSLYYDQLKNFFYHIPKKHIKVVIFEEFLMNKQNSLREICAHIGVDADLIPKELVDTHKNKALIPKYPAIHRLKNRFFREAGNLDYYSHLPVKPEFASRGKMKVNMLKLINKIHRRLNPLIEINSQKMKPSTKRFLDDFFKEKLEGINDLLEKDVMSIWFDKIL